MEKADFEEKTFEGAANAELAREEGRVFTPGQVEEGILGYDASVVPGQVAREILERVAGIQPNPAVWLTPNWWIRCAARPQASLLPSRFASLLLQYKRPELRYGVSEKLFAAHAGPFFRYAFRREQHQTLVRLDEALQDQAIVRYAAPCTHRRKTLEQWQIDTEVLAHTNFVSPRRIGLRHKAWTYSSPGGVGFRNEFRNPEEDGVSADSMESVSRLLVSDARGQSLTEHLSTLVRLLAGGGIDATVDQIVRADERVPRGARDAVGAVVRLRLIGVELLAAGTSWWMREL